MKGCIYTTTHGKKVTKLQLGKLDREEGKEVPMSKENNRTKTERKATEGVAVDVAMNVTCATTLVRKQWWRLKGRGRPPFI